MPWTDGLDETILGHAKLNGFDPAGNPEEIARAAVQKHFETSKLVTNPGEYLRLPKDANDADALNAIYSALGAAKDPKEYDFAEVKFKDGSALDDKFTEVLRGVAAKLRLSPAAAKEMAAAYTGWVDGNEAASASERTVARTAEDLELRRSWGGNYDLFLSNAKRATQLLGMNEAQVASLEDSMGYAAAWNTFRGLADRLGESKLLDPSREGGGSGFKAMSREEARAKHDELMHDPVFRQRYVNVNDPAHKAAMADMDHLNRIIVGMPV